MKKRFWPLCANISITLIVLAGLFSSVSIAQQGNTSPPATSAEQKPVKTPDSPPKINFIPPKVRERIRQVAPAVCLVLVRNSNDPPDQEARPRGSAVIIRKDGIAVTCYHVITQDKVDKVYDEIYLSMQATDSQSDTPPPRYRIKSLLVSKEYDLALLRIISDSNGQPVKPNTTFAVIDIGDSRKAQLLDDLFIIGFPQKGGLTVTVNTGVVEGKDILDNWIKTDARLIHGNSGGAAVNDDGQLIGIPTKVVVDSQPIDKNGDGQPDRVQTFGAVGFLRPAHLVAAMMEKLAASEEASAQRKTAPTISSSGASKEPDGVVGAQSVQPQPSITVRGIVRSVIGGKAIAGARVGLIPFGSIDVTAENLLTWGGTNAEGKFELNKPVPPGRYSLKVKAIGYVPRMIDIDVNKDSPPLVVDLKPE